MNTETMYHIGYQKPKVTLLQQSGIGVAEIAGRTCYDSFENSENTAIQNFHSHLKLDLFDPFEVNNVESSELLDSLAWVHHHHSIIEHATLSFLVQGTSRGTLQEHARHRLQNISVRSTRYVMAPVLHAFVSSLLDKKTAKNTFCSIISKLDMLVTTDKKYNDLEFGAIFDKLTYQMGIAGEEEFHEMSIAKSSLELLDMFSDPSMLFEALQAGKRKRNVGDGFKHIVTDNWKVDMVITFNLRSLKNYFDLRDSGSAWFQIQWLAQAMKEVTPVKYLRLIDKKFKNA